jgi:hypothetical protein
MAEYEITTASGARETLDARAHRVDGPWLVFETASGERRLNAETVHEVRGPVPAEPKCLRDGTLRVVAGVALAIVGAFALPVGLFDAFRATTVSGRAYGGLLALAAVACAVGVDGLRRGTAAGANRALAGSIAATFVPLTLLGFQLIGRGENRSLTFVLLASASALLAIALWLLHDGARLELPTLLKAGVSLGVVIGLLQFWYDKEYLPASREAGMSASVELTAGPVADGETVPDFVTAEISIENVSGTRVRTLGSHYRLWNDDPAEPEGGRALVAEGDLGFRPSGWLSPGQKYTTDVVFPVPDEARPGMSFVVDVHVAKGNRLGHGRETPCPHDQCTRAWRLLETSLVTRLTREPRYLEQVPVVEDVEVLATGERQARMVGLRVCIVRGDGNCRDDWDAHLNELYGRATVAASTEMVFDPPSSPAPGD